MCAGRRVGARLMAAEAGSQAAPGCTQQQSAALRAPPLLLQGAGDTLLHMGLLRAAICNSCPDWQQRH